MQNDIILENQERQECEIWSRVMGYYRPVSQYNKGKQSEYGERVFYKGCSCSKEDKGI
jgi:anaerobic ribonucleoside-triphosphate reductase